MMADLFGWALVYLFVGSTIWMLFNSVGSFHDFYRRTRGQAPSTALLVCSTVMGIVLWPYVVWKIVEVIVQGVRAGR